MNCANCGAEVLPGQSFCKSCGQPVAAQPQTDPQMNGVYQQPGANQQMNGAYQQPGMNQQMNGAYQQPGMNQQMNGAYQQPGMNQQPGANPQMMYGQQQYQQPPYQQPPYQQAGAIEQPMKWYKFISYVQLPLSALGFLSLGTMLMTGGHYEGQSALVYAVFGSLKTVDIIFGLLYFALMAIAIFVCIKMNKRKKDAVKWYLTYLVVSIIASVLYMILVYAATGIFTGSGSIMVTLVTNIVMVVVNKIYFDKRKAYFVN